MPSRKDKSSRGRTQAPEEPDHVDRLREQWREQRPDIDTGAMSVLGRINRIAQLVEPPIVAVMSDAGIDRGEFDVLASLRRAGPPFRLSPTALYTALLLSSGGLSNRLRRLERKGLVGREPDEADGRSQLVALSDRGVALVDAVFEQDMQVENALLSTLGKRDLDTLATLLRKLARAVARPG